MAAVAEAPKTEIAVQPVGQLVGPGSEFEKKRIALKDEDIAQIMRDLNWVE